MLTEVKQEDFEPIYQIMEASFPLDERRPYAQQRALLDRADYQIRALSDGGLLGFITVYEMEEWVFAEHFAVAPQWRNQGIGSVILKELRQWTAKPICLEVEPPETKQAIRRIGFYRRNGFVLQDDPYVQPALSPGQSPVELKIMATKPLNRDEFAQLRDKLYRDVYHCNP